MAPATLLQAQHPDTNPSPDHPNPSPNPNPAAYHAELPPLIPKQIRGREAGGHAFCVAVEWQRACVVTPLLFLATVFLSWGIFLPLCSVEALP